MSSTPIIQGADWDEEFRIYDEDGGDEDLTGATLRWALADRTGALLIDINSDDDADRFDTLDAAGDASASGPVVRINLTPTETADLTVGDRFHQLKATLDDADSTVRKSDKKTVRIEDSIFE